MKVMMFCKLVLIFPVLATLGCVPWNLTGNSGTNPDFNFLGTTDDQPLVIKTNNKEAVRVDSQGNVGLGTASPRVALEINGDFITKGPWIDVRAYGAIPDDKVDDTYEILQAIKNTPLRGTLYIPLGTYNISGDPAVAFPNPITVFAYGAIFDYGDGGGTAVKLGVSGPAWKRGLNLFGLHVKRNFMEGDSAQSTLLGIGILHSNVKGGRVADITVEGFAKGLYIVGDEEGNAFNFFENNLLMNNLHGIEIDTIDPLLTGWSNENVFMGGRVYLSPGFHDFVGTKFIYIAKSGNNHHRFVGMTLESEKVERKLDIAGSWNMFLSNRYEGTNGITNIEFGRDSRNNVILYGNFDGSGVDTILDQGENNHIYTNAGVGIGTANPGAKLDVVHSGRARIRVRGTAGLGTTRAEFVADRTDPTRGGGLRIVTNSVDNWWVGIPYNNGSPSEYFIIDDNDTIVDGSYFTIDHATGHIGIGETSPSSALDVNGDVEVNGMVVLNSDIKLKKNVKTIDSALEKVMKLRGVEFKWKTDEPENGNRREDAQIGLIAQEVEPILPEIVRTDLKGYKSVAYSNVTALLIESTKAQTRIIEEQKAEIAVTRAELTELKAKMARLAASLQKTEVFTAPNEMNTKMQNRKFW